MNSPLLEKISQPSDLKKLSSQQERERCAQNIREFLLDNVSKTGGHLASNLACCGADGGSAPGADHPTDEIVFDVGHQCYTHKLLTGRRGGLCRSCASWMAFPVSRPATKVSMMLLLPVTATRRFHWHRHWLAPKSWKEAGQVVAIIGDGAFTGGMVYEGMNNISNLDNLLVILNDNKMSISKMSAQLSRYLTICAQTRAISMPRIMETASGAYLAVGTALVDALQKAKKTIRCGIYHSTMFEEMGFQYYGPVDGNNDRT